MPSKKYEYHVAYMYKEEKDSQAYTYGHMTVETEVAVSKNNFEYLWKTIADHNEVAKDRVVITNITRIGDF